MEPVIYTIDLGVMPYNESWQYQELLQQKLIKVKRERTSITPPSGYLLFVEHPHVYTVGKNGNWDHLLFTDDILAQKGIELIKTDRGGDITYHGPGQIVGYPILDLEQFGLGVARYVENLEEVIIRTAALFNITARRIPSQPGVWVENNKLCALGIKCSRYVTMHGFALNVHPDLDFYRGIIPCGLDKGGVTSFAQLLHHPPSPDQVRSRLLKEFEQLFECQTTQKPVHL
ncbi:MAG: lipoyl(octanoyl) transferase LipB [Balneolales bacterium]